MKHEQVFMGLENIRNPIERARAEQAIAVGTAIGDAINGLSAALGRGIAALRKHKPAKGKPSLA